MSAIRLSWCVCVFGSYYFGAKYNWPLFSFLGLGVWLYAFWDSLDDDLSDEIMYAGVLPATFRVALTTTIPRLMTEPLLTAIMLTIALTTCLLSGKRLSPKVLLLYALVNSISFGYLLPIS